MWEVLDVSWANDELAKPAEKRHPLLNWLASVFPAIESLPADTYAIDSVRSREAQVYLAFAYDLWTVDHNARVELKEVFRRLMITDQFHGAVYELRVMAAFFRAGFLLRSEDETDSTISHHEFHALHLETQSKYSVECKARGVSGILGKAGVVPELSTIRPKIRRHIRKALNKRAEHTRIVFIDVNLPIAAGSPMDWMEDIKAEITWILDRERADDPYPPAFLIFTNHPAHYSGPDNLLHESGVAMKAFKMPELYPDADSGIRLHPAVGELLFYLKRYESVPNQWFDRSSTGQMSIVDAG